MTINFGYPTPGIIVTLPTFGAPTPPPVWFYGGGLYITFPPDIAGLGRFCTWLALSPSYDERIYADNVTNSGPPAWQFNFANPPATPPGFTACLFVQDTTATVYSVCGLTLGPRCYRIIKNYIAATGRVHPPTYYWAQNAIFCPTPHGATIYSSFNDATVALALAIQIFPHDAPYLSIQEGILPYSLSDPGY